MHKHCAPFGQRLLHFCPKMYLCAKRASKVFVLPKEMLLSFSSGPFLTNYDVLTESCNMLLYTPLYQNKQKERKIIQQRLLQEWHSSSMSQDILFTALFLLFVWRHNCKGTFTIFILSFLQRFLVPVLKRYLKTFFLVSETDNSKPKRQRLPFLQVIKMLWSDGLRAYSNSYTLKWSLWVVISTCVNYQVNKPGASLNTC